MARRKIETLVYSQLYNEAVIILFPRRGKYGGPIIPVIILIGALTSTIIVSVEIQHTRERQGEVREKEGEIKRERESERGSGRKRKRKEKGRRARR